MANETLWLSAGFAVVTAALYAYVGRRIWMRDVAGEGKLAVDLFAVWWLALAAATAVGGLNFALAALGQLNLALLVSTTYLSLFFICVALWGLLYYLIYLYTGRRSAIVPLTLFYLAYYFSLAYYVTSHRPAGVQVERWSVTLEYTVPLAGDPVASLLLILLVVPQIVGALLYFLLYFRVDTPTQRYRIALVSWSIIIWFSSALFASALGLKDLGWWPIVSRLIGLFAALVILMAYVPPRWVRRRFKVRGLETHSGEAGPDA